MSQSSAGASSWVAVAQWAESHPAIVKVSYPGLKSHPDHDLAEKLLDNYGGMMGLEIKGGVKATGKFLNKLRVVTHAPSLAGAESLISEPRLTSHSHMSPEERAKNGIPDGFVRLSCGIEDADDATERLLFGEEGQR